MNCPRCHTPLEQTFYQKIIFFYCPCCHGQAVTLSALRSLGVEQDNITAIWRSANAKKNDSQIRCPECSNPMQLLKLDDGSNIFYIDLCLCCHLLWFDFGELDHLPVPETLPEEKLPVTIQDKLPERSSPALTDDSPPTMLDHLGIDSRWTMTAIRLLIKLVFRI